MTGQDILKIRDQLKTERTPLEAHWAALSELYMPFRINPASHLPDIPSAEAVNDSTARDCAMILANGLASLIIPREEVWFELMPPMELADDDDAVAAYRSASVTIREYLERSNFYEEVQEFLIESPVYGTAAMFIGDSDDSDVLYFKHQPVQTYWIGEDARGRINVVLRELHLTADQAAREFGEDKLPLAIRNKVKQPLGLTEKSVYIHAVMPNYDAPEDEDPEDRKKAFYSCVVEETSKLKVQEGGFDEFPFVVHRYRRFGRCAYGFGPGTTGLADARQLDFLERLADAAAEKAVFPPVVAPSSLEGDIGQGALEITYVDESQPNSAAMLREWAPAGRYDFAKDRLNDKRTQLRRVFHVDLFQLFAQRAAERGPMTATEANLIQGEKLTQFSPVFGRLVSEFLTPALVRMFGILLRRNALGDEFAALLTERGVPAPTIRYRNALMLAMQQRANASLSGYIELTAPVVQMMGVPALDAINISQVMRDTARNAGFSENWIRSKKEIEALEAQRAEAEQAQQEAAMAQQMASAGKDFGATPPDVREGMARAVQQ
jgi:hypothetical protein